MCGLRWMIAGLATLSWRPPLSWRECRARHLQTSGKRSQRRKSWQHFLCTNVSKRFLSAARCRCFGFYHSPSDGWVLVSGKTPATQPHAATRVETVPISSTKVDLSRRLLRDEKQKNSWTPNVQCSFTWEQRELTKTTLSHSEVQNLQIQRFFTRPKPHEHDSSFAYRLRNCWKLFRRRRSFFNKKFIAGSTDETSWSTTSSWVAFAFSACWTSACLSNKKLRTVSSPPWLKFKLTSNGCLWRHIVFDDLLRFCKMCSITPSLCTVDSRPLLPG